jgi:hypothetical protein
MPSTTDFSLPADDLGGLGKAFHMIGRHRFGPIWTKGMETAVRLGQRGRDKEVRARASWALKALTQCVENGWLPLVYFVDGRRVRYWDAPDGLALHALYPQPTDDLDGQIELEGGGIFPCLIDTSALERVLREKFGRTQFDMRGRPPQYRAINEVLDQYFRDHPTGTPNKNVISDVGKLVAESDLPRKTTLQDRINKARDRAIERIRSAN